MGTTMISEFATDKVEQTLFGWILSGRLRAGDKLPSVEQLARDFGVGYGAVSRAVSRLTVRKLVRIDPGDGAYVVALLEVAGLGLLWPLLSHCDQDDRRHELLAQFYGFLRPMMSEWAERAASNRTSDQLGWLNHYVLVLQDRRQLRCPRGEIGGVEYEIARVLAAAAGNFCFTFMLNELEEMFTSDALVKEDEVLIPVETYWALWEALRERDGKKAAKLVEAALWARESSSIQELRKRGWREQGGFMTRGD